MNLGFVKVATFTPEIRVGDVEFNLQSIKNGIDLAREKGVKILVFPELTLTGSTAGDLFFSKPLLDGALNALKDITAYTTEKNILVFVGLPLMHDGKIYNACAGVCNGMVLGIVPKSYIPAYGEVNQRRWFSEAQDGLSVVVLDKDCVDDGVPFGKNIIFVDGKDNSLKICVDFSNSLKLPCPQSFALVENGAKIIVCPCADNEQAGAPEQRLNMVKNTSKIGVCAVLLSNTGSGESTTDAVYSGHSVIGENGQILNQTTPFENCLCVADVDLQGLDFERSKLFNRQLMKKTDDTYYVGFCLENDNCNFTRDFDKTPFIKAGEEDFILQIQAQGLKKRIQHTNSKTVVLGLSGGLDSTLALIVAVKAVKLAGKSTKDVLAVTMPCFGTSSRTLDNSIRLAKSFGVTLKKVDITKSVKRHLKDIGHSEDVHDPAYENAQARERTQVLMDIANMYGGLVIGTGDLSELALGWATYNGDHMSMYAVNGSIPKTLVRHLTNYYAENCKGKQKATLLDILDTPVSPELIPSGDNTIKQVTEDIVGPYVLHDFFLYNMIKKGYEPKKLYHVAVKAFENEFDSATVLKWLKTFVRRFFNQQFKRSCLPDGVKATEISLSPRGGWNMPSDAISKIWLDQLENL